MWNKNGYSRWSSICVIVYDLHGWIWHLLLACGVHINGWKGGNGDTADKNPRKRGLSYETTGDTCYGYSMSSSFSPNIGSKWDLEPSSLSFLSRFAYIIMEQQQQQHQSPNDAPTHGTRYVDIHTLWEVHVTTSSKTYSLLQSKVLLPFGNFHHQHGRLITKRYPQKKSFPCWILYRRH